MSGWRDDVTVQRWARAFMESGLDDQFQQAMEATVAAQDRDVRAKIDLEIEGLDTVEVEGMKLRDVLVYREDVFGALDGVLGAREATP